jgi:hypothetical protein
MAVPFLAVLASCLGVLYAYRDPLAAMGAGQIDVERVADRRLQAARLAPVKHPRIVLLGDSLNVCRTPPEPRLQSVGMALNATLKEARRPIELLDLTQPGLLPIYAYALLDEALATGASLVVVEVNLRLFLDPMARPGWETMPGLVRKLDLAQALHVRRALEHEGMTVLDPPLLQLRERVGLLHVFEGARQGALDWLVSTSERVTSALALPRRTLPPLAEVARRMSLSYMVDYTSHPTASALRALVSDLHDTRIPVVLYVSPINVEAQEQAPGFDPVELERRIDELRISVGATPAEWLDLHATQPAGRFRDFHNHLFSQGCIDVGRALAARVIAALPKRAGGPDARPPNPPS